MFMEGIKDKPKCRVELHIHLDGAMRHETIWELCRKKDLPLPGDGSLTALREAAVLKEGSNLPCFLRPLLLVAPALQGDLLSIERIAREFVEDRSRDHIAYCEARFCPHLLLPPSTPQPQLNWDNTPQTDTDTEPVVSNGNGCIRLPSCTAEDVLEAVLKGVAEGEELCPGTKVRIILCCIKSMPDIFWDILKLCEQYKNKGVVGIDIAGCHLSDATIKDFSEGSEVFQAAAAKGIHRTVHAGEDSGPLSVQVALTEMKAERIGHGYRVIEDEEVYERCREANIHFEACPTSSYLTGAMKDLALPSKRHPIIRFAEDGTSYSINTDDPFLTGTTLSDEYALLRGWGFTEAHFVKANFNAALRSFLPTAEKQQLLQQLKEAYGIVDALPSSPVVVKTGNTSPNRPTISVSTWENRA